MKATKRILAFAMALALGLALLAPTVSAADDPNAPVITKQPSGPEEILTGRTLTLEVQAQAPAAAPGTISVAWFVVDEDGNLRAAPIATRARVAFPTTSLGHYLYSDDTPAEDDIFIPGGIFKFYAVVTNTYTDGGGTQQTATITSDTVRVNIINRPVDYIALYWNATWHYGFLRGLSLIPVNMLLATTLIFGTFPDYLYTLIVSWFY